jgi:hypothetical protein
MDKAVQNLTLVHRYVGWYYYTVLFSLGIVLVEFLSIAYSEDFIP